MRTRLYPMIILCAALVSLAAAYAPASAAEPISDARLRLDATPRDVPFECGDAYQATRSFAVDKNPSVDTLHTLVRTDLACIRSRYGGGEVGNMMLLAAGAAALLASRRETGSAAHNDRVMALRLTRSISGIESGTGGVSFSTEQAGNYEHQVAHTDPNARTGRSSDYLSEAQQVHDEALAQLRAERPASPTPTTGPAVAAPTPPHTLVRRDR